MVPLFSMGVRRGCFVQAFSKLSSSSSHSKQDSFLWISGKAQDKRRFVYVSSLRASTVRGQAKWKLAIHFYRTYQGSAGGCSFSVSGGVRVDGKKDE